MHLVQGKFVSARCAHRCTAILHYIHTGVCVCVSSINFPHCAIDVQNSCANFSPLCFCAIHVHWSSHVCSISQFANLQTSLCATEAFTAFQVNARRPVLMPLKAPQLIMPPWHELCKKCYQHFGSSKCCNHLFFGG